LFVNRFIKTLHNDAAAIEAGRNNVASNFLYQTEANKIPKIKIGGYEGFPGTVLYNALVNEDWACQFFDFGVISNDEIKTECFTVAQGFKHGLVDVPAPVCWMEHKWRDDKATTIYSGYLFIQSEKYGHIIGLEIRRIAALELRGNLESSEYFTWDGIILGLPYRPDSEGYNARILTNTTNGKINVSNIFDPLMTMLGRLNADGIEQERIPAPVKLNRQRAKKGLPGVVAHTEIKISPHRPILGHSGPIDGDYTPKRYHFRRGHVRHFQNGEITWVRPAFCGDPSIGSIKHTYTVTK
tara:strand:+ start:1523 stop:2413 length:891 start_codon:yes stop_codon:yes gene_type:complete